MLMKGVNIVISRSLLFILLFNGLAYAADPSIDCPSKTKDFTKTWKNYAEHVKKQGEKHKDYEVLYAYLMQKNMRRKYIGHCLSELDNFEKSKKKGDLTHLKSWVGCIKTYFQSTPPELVKKLSQCPFYLQDK